MLTADTHVRSRAPVRLFKYNKMFFYASEVVNIASLTYENIQSPVVAFKRVTLSSF